MEATHVSQLIKAGYRIPEPTEKINMDTTRGLFRVQQKNDRNDMAEMQFKDADSVATVDPGFVRPMQVCTLRATQLDMDAIAVARAAEC